MAHSGWRLAARLLSDPRYVVVKVGGDFTPFAIKAQMWRFDPSLDVLPVYMGQLPYLGQDHFPFGCAVAPDTPAG